MKYSLIVSLFLFLITLTSCQDKEYLKQENSVENVSGKLLQINNSPWNTIEIPSGTLIHAKVLVGSQVSLKNASSGILLLKAETVVLSDKNIVLYNCRIFAIPNKKVLKNRLIVETNSISCRDKNENLFESYIQGYLADKDNITGIKGSITNLMEGINSLPKEVRKNIKNILFQNKSKNVAMDEISRWYLDQMKETYPILTIESGKEVNIITTKEIVLKYI